MNSKRYLYSLKKYIYTIIFIILSSCSQEESIMTQFDSCNIDVIDGKHNINYININPEGINNIIYLGKKYPTPFKIREVTQHINLSFSRYINNIDLSFNIVNNTDIDSKLDFDIYFIDSKTKEQTKRNIKRILKPGKAITFRYKFK